MSRRIDDPTNSLSCFSESSPPIMRNWQCEMVWHPSVSNSSDLLYAPRRSELESSPHRVAGAPPLSPELQCSGMKDMFRLPLRYRHQLWGSDYSKTTSPAGMNTTGHSRPFAACTVISVTFCERKSCSLRLPPKRATYRYRCVVFLRTRIC